MSAIFLYGTLRHLPLLEIVLGRPVPPETCVPATLENARVTWVAGQSYPMIALEGGAGVVHGLRLAGLSEQDLARLDFYEGGFGYSLRAVDTSEGVAQTYLPGPEIGPPGAPWSLEDWVREWGALSMEAAEEAMRLFGRRSAQEIARMFPTIRGRAAARLRARAEGGASWRKVEIFDRTMAYADFFALEEMHVRLEKFEGGMTPPLRRAVFLGMDAAILLPYDPRSDRVLLVEQHRMGPLGRSDPDPWMLEPIAGHVDPRETHQDAARREAREEAGLELTALHGIAKCYPSPGASSEFFYVFVGLCDLSAHRAGTSGVAAEGENILTHVMDYKAFFTKLQSGGFRVAPLILAGWWLAQHRDALRSA
jgi:nudix-type nucleoside diphosphatase (YffH/AdpP family)